MSDDGLIAAIARESFGPSPQPRGVWATRSIWASTIPETSSRAGQPTDRCRKCDEQLGRLARYVYSNGRSSLRWQCSQCGDYGSFSDITTTFLEQFDVALLDLPVCLDASGTTPPCVVCGSRSAEWHHWAPSSIFDDNETDLSFWSSVGDYLCTHHHQQWHARMRDHGLRWPSEIART